LAETDRVVFILFESLYADPLLDGTLTYSAETDRVDFISSPD
jgi:hypothetical protein